MSLAAHRLPDVLLKALAIELDDVLDEPWNWGCTAPCCLVTCSRSDFPLPCPARNCYKRPGVCTSPWRGCRTCHEISLTRPVYRCPLYIVHSVHDHCPCQGSAVARCGVSSTLPLECRAPCPLYIVHFVQNDHCPLSWSSPWPW